MLVAFILSWLSLISERNFLIKVSFKYAKAPGGVLKTCAQPEVQWKLQQFQDAGNFCCMALNTIAKVSTLTTDIYFICFLKKSSVNW